MLVEAFGLLNWAIVGIYLMANIGLGWYLGREVTTGREYEIGTRRSPWWAIGISVIATYVSALSFLGGPAWAYGDGMAALAIHVNYPLVVFIVVAVFLPFFYNSGVTSIYDYLERRFGIAARSLGSTLFLITQTITTASILTATAVVITFATGLDVRLSIVGMVAIVVLYTLLGGMNAVIWTDVLQGVILFLGAGIILWNVLDATAPLSGALSTLAAEGKLDPINSDLDFSVAPTIWAGVLAMTLYHVTVYGANQMMVQRALAAKSIGDAKKAYLLMGYGGFFIYFLFFFIGALLFVHFEGATFDQPNAIILDFAQSLAIPGLLGIIAAAVLSASMSSLSSALNSLSTASVSDFYKRFICDDADESHYLAVTRGLTVFWGVVAIPIAFAFIESGGSILEQLTKVGSYFVGANLAMFGMGFFSKSVSQRSLLIGVASGFATLVIVINGLPSAGLEPANIAWPWYVVIGGGTNVIVALIASLLADQKSNGWHEQSVPGQIAKFRAEGLAEKDGGWYIVPGKVDKASWGLLAVFVLSIAFLAYFGTLG
ncbi:MAG: sodium:solute symporter family transporter [Erythrobacter sp.]|uniref:sodium:solute symporter family transporter n=1 Tax=Erythrobacter sp. TaxID=1042 RepID=UPI003A86CF9B